MSTPLVTAEGLVLEYDGHRAVDESDFCLPSGGITAVIGPNGSGKSTLLNAIAGLIEPTAGTLEVQGMQPGQAGSRISYVMQAVTVPVGIPLTVTEVVGMGRYPNLGLFRRHSAQDRRAVSAAMERLNITGLAKRHLTELSGGQRQRAYVAQGLAQQHQALLLDEPLTGLDLVSARTIDAIIHDEADSGGSVVLTTHDLDEARAADYVLLMSGRVVAAGPPRRVLTRHNLEIAYGLGALHESEGFLDDPGDPHTHPSR